MINKFRVLSFIAIIATLLCCTKQLDDSIIDFADVEIVPESELNAENSISNLTVRNGSGGELETTFQEISGDVIIVRLPTGTNVRDLQLDFTKPDTATILQSTQSVDFSDLSIRLFTVVAENGDTNTYAVKITAPGTQEPGGPGVSGDSFITNVLSITDSSNIAITFESTIDPALNTIGITVPVGTDTSDLSINFTISEGATIESPLENRDFISGQNVFVDVVAEDDTTERYLIKVELEEEEDLSNENLVSAVVVKIADVEIPDATATIDNDLCLIKIEVPNDTPINALTLDFTIPETATLDDLTTNLDFSIIEMKIFTVVAENLVDEKIYTVEVCEAPITQRQALLNMYLGPEGIAEEYQWDLSEGSDIGLWTGVTTDSDGNVIGLKNDIGFEGRILRLDDNLKYLPFLVEIEGLEEGIRLPTNEELVGVVFEDLTRISSEFSFSDFPEWLLNQPNITSISYEGSGAVIIPEGIENLTNLVRLSFVDSQLETLPEIIADLPNLIFLDVSQNPNLVIPQAICDWGERPGNTLNIAETLGCDDDVQAEAFITVWTGTEVTIPINDDFTYNYNIDWDNDGMPDETGITGEANNIYTNEGPHTVRITGGFPAINFGSFSSGDPDAIIDVVQWGTGEWLGMAGAFINCENVVFSAADVPDLRNVTSMLQMFQGALVANPDVSEWDTTSITNMQSVFQGAIAANPDVSNWNTSSVTSINSIFASARVARPDVSNWDTSNVTTMFQTFAFASSANPNVSNWDTSNVTSMSSMFRNSGITNPDFSNPNDITEYMPWDISNVTSMNGMFDSITLTTNVYDQILEDFSSRTHNNNIVFSGGNSTYCNVAARDILINDSWTITDSDLDDSCSVVLSSENEVLTVRFVPVDGSAPFDGIIAGTTITAEAPPGTDISALMIEATYSEGATSGLSSEDDFDFLMPNGTPGQETITVTAEDGTEQIYTVTVTVENVTIAPGEAFITTWTGTEVTIPINDDFTYNYNIDWDNDGIPDELGITGEANNTYANEGPHTIQITGEFPAINLGSDSTGDPDAVIDVAQWGTGEWLSMQVAFRDCVNLEVNATDIPDLSNVTNLGGMFFNATSANPDISNWDTSNVTAMSSMFFGATSANPDVSDWDTSNVIRMSGMFFRATSANPDVSNWDTSNVIDMSSMFREATLANPDVSDWDTSNVNTMFNMFREAVSADPDVSLWNTSNVRNMEDLFNNATSANPDVSNWDTSRVTRMINIFREATSANPDVSSWNTSNVNSMLLMFLGATSADPDVSLWDTSNVTNMGSLFGGATSANPDVSNWNTSNVINMSNMFAGATSANPDVSLWDTSNLTNMNQVFSGATSANPDVSGWDISNVINMIGMFEGVNLATEAYDQILEDFSSKPHNNDVEFGGGNSTYCNAAARDILINDGWIITDDGLDASCVEIPFSFDESTGSLTALPGEVVFIRLALFTELIDDSDLGLENSQLTNIAEVNVRFISEPGSPSQLLGSYLVNDANITDFGTFIMPNLGDEGQVLFTGSHMGLNFTGSTIVTISADGKTFSVTMTNGSGIPVN